MCDICERPWLHPEEQPKLGSIVFRVIRKEMGKEVGQVHETRDYHQASWVCRAKQTVSDERFFPPVEEFFIRYTLPCCGRVDEVRPQQVDLDVVLGETS